MKLSKRFNKDIIYSEGGIGVVVISVIFLSMAIILLSLSILGFDVKTAATSNYSIFGWLVVALAIVMGELAGHCLKKRASMRKRR